MRCPLCHDLAKCVEDVQRRECARWQLNSSTVVWAAGLGNSLAGTLANASGPTADVCGSLKSAPRQFTTSRWSHRSTEQWPAFWFHQNRRKWFAWGRCRCIVRRFHRARQTFRIAFIGRDNGTRHVSEMHESEGTMGPQKALKSTVGVAMGTSASVAVVVGIGLTVPLTPGL